MTPTVARQLWALGEPFHALPYFAEEGTAAARSAGLSGFWPGYFAMRAAPLGPVGAEVVTASFYGFAPGFVRRSVPAIWDVVTPAEALAARLAGVHAAVRRVLRDEWVGAAATVEAARLAEIAAAEVDVPGRLLAAANRALPLPASPHLALWQALTTLREHRGDGHNAQLLARAISGLEANVLAAAAGRSDRAWLLRARGWTEAEWDAAAAGLTARGWLTGGRLTAAGVAVVAEIEADTDRLAVGPWQALGDGGCARLAELLAPVRRAVVEAGEFPPGNPIGVPDVG